MEIASLVHEGHAIICTVELQGSKSAENAVKYRHCQLLVPSMWSVVATLQIRQNIPTMVIDPWVHERCQLFLLFMYAVVITLLKLHSIKLTKSVRTPLV